MQRSILQSLGTLTIVHGLASLAASGAPFLSGGPRPPIYVYELTHQPANAKDYDEVAALASMQGIINRDRPLLYVNNSAYGRPRYWLDILSRDGRWLEGRERQTIAGLDAVRELAAERLKGAVIWDPDVPASLNVATTIAGVEEAVILSPSLADQCLARWRLAVTRDLRGMFTGSETGSRKNDAYRWAIREYIETGKCSPHLLCLYTDSFRDREPGQIAYLIVRDWAVKNRAFTYDLSPWGDEAPGDDPGQPLGTDLATYEMLLAATLRQSAGKQMTEVAGFFNFHKYSNMPDHPSRHEPVPTEWETVHLITPYNCYQNTATEFCYNQSFHCHMPFRPLRQARPAARRTLENTSYIAILMADYDSAFPLYHFLPEHWSDRERGSIPLNWGINPNLIETYPDIVSYVYETASPRDVFVADASAAGYFNPNRVQRKYLPLFVKHNLHFYRLTDMTVSGMVLDWDQPTDEVKDAYARFSPAGYATIVADLHGSGGRPPRPQVWKGMPIVPLLGADPNSAEYTAGEIYRALRQRRRDEPGFYNFRCVWVSPTQVKASLALFAEKHPEEAFEVVDLYTFFDLFKQYDKRIAARQVVSELPEWSAWVEGYRFSTRCTVRNVTGKALKIAFRATGLDDNETVPASVRLAAGREIDVFVSGHPVSDTVVIEAAGSFGSRQWETKVTRLAAAEVIGEMPHDAVLQFVCDRGADELPSTTGERMVDAGGSVCRAARAGITAPGYLAYGPYAGLDRGRYVALFRVRRTSDGSGLAAQVDVCDGAGPVIAAARGIRVEELPLNEYRSVVLTFGYDRTVAAYESRLHWSGTVSLEFDRVLIWRITE